MRSRASKSVRVEEAVPFLYLSCPLTMRAAMRRWLGGRRRRVFLEMLA